MKNQQGDNMNTKENALDKAFIGHPKPLFSLSIVELWERFSYYGIRPLLVLFMAAVVTQGGLGLERADAAAIVGIFGGCLYLAALPGGWIADNILGQKRAVFYGAFIIALGHLSIALSIFNSLMFFIGLALIVIGTGLFKTCASVMVGMLYRQNDVRRDSGFTIFYMGINIGGFIAPLICGFAQQQYGWHIGFGMGGIGMLISLLIFYFKTIPDFDEFKNKVGIEQNWDAPLHQNKNAKTILLAAVAIIIAIFGLIAAGFIDLSPVSLAKKMVMIIIVFTAIYFLYLFFFNNLSLKDKKSLGVVLILFVASSFFWSTFEQQPTSFNLFAQDFTDRIVFGFEIPTAWFQAVNSLFIILLAPVTSALWIFLARKNLEVSSIAKFIIGLLGAAACFGIMLLASKLIIANGGGLVSPMWIVVSLFCLTIGELALSPIGLSIMTQIAPKAIKSQIMGLFFVSIALGNVVAGLVGGEVSIENIDVLPSVFGQSVWVLLIVAAVLFIIKNPVMRMLKEKE